MIPPSFDYVRPATVDDAVAALAEHGEDAKVLAGGQSLIPLLRLRLAAPTTLVDVGRLEELHGIRLDRGPEIGTGGGTVVIGAATPHHEVLRHPLVREHAPLVAKATETVADPAVRHRGTFGGSLAHADPAGDLPAVALAAEAELVIAGPSGRRTVPAQEFFVDYLETALGPGELLVEVRVPAHGGWGTHYEKFHRVAQAWAIVGVAAMVRREGDTIAEARVGLTNMGPTPLRAIATEQALAGARLPNGSGNGAVAAAAGHAAEGTSPSSDLSAAADYREHLARVLTRRAVEAALR
jgi:aerobic carbon-monoxide dehydrogenase medium subunit